MKSDQSKTKSRKEEIVYATLKLASEKGLGSVSMQMIADQVGITKASLYNHFKSRDEIVDAMYEILRDSSKRNVGVDEVDYDKLTSGRTLPEILTDVVEGYRSLTREPQMKMFYTVIMSERPINPAAADIIVRETKTMISATKMLFYALQAKKVVDFKDVDAAAFSFAMAVHSIIDYEFDLEQIGEKTEKDMMKEFIMEFCRNYPFSS